MLAAGTQSGGSPVATVVIGVVFVVLGVVFAVWSRPIARMFRRHSFLPLPAKPRNRMTDFLLGTEASPRPWFMIVMGACWAATGTVLVIAARAA